MPEAQPRDPRAAFSLIELSVVIAILAVIAVMGLEMTANYLNRTAYNTTIARINAIDEAIVRYRRIHNRLPCPSALGDDPGMTCFAKERNGSGGAGTCNDNTGQCRANADIPGVYRGYVPLRDLGLPLSYFTDGYGIRFFYVVSADLVQNNTYTPGNLLDNFENGAEVIQIRSGKLDGSCGSSGSLCQDRGNASYILFSTGPDRRGGQTLNGTNPARCLNDNTAAVDGMIDSANCRFNTSDATYPLQKNGSTPINPPLSKLIFYDSRYNNGTQEASHFDDIVRWRSKGSL